MQKILLKNPGIDIMYNIMNLAPVYARTIEMTRKGLDTILPARCPLTGEYVEAQGMLSGKAWRALNFIAAPYCRCCGMPFSFTRQEDEEGEEAPAKESGELCTACLEKRPPYGSARAALIYDDTSRALILGFKHGDKTYLIRSLAPWLQMAGREFLPEADFLIPVPLHRSRLRARRYNQAALLSYGLQKITGIECLPDALLRVRATPSQGHLTTDERRKNVRKAFRLKEKYKSRIKGKTLVLIDDVYTTGATARECAKALKSGGAGAVHVLTLARVVKDEFR